MVDQEQYNKDVEAFREAFFKRITSLIDEEFLGNIEAGSGKIYLPDMTSAIAAGCAYAAGYFEGMTMKAGKDAWGEDLTRFMAYADDVTATIINARKVGIKEGEKQVVIPIPDGPIH